MMQFDKQNILGVIYTFKVEIQLPGGTSKYHQYEGRSYETFLIKLREAQTQIDNLYQIIERPEVTEF